MAEDISALSTRIHDDFRSLEQTANKSFSMMLDAQQAMAGHVEAGRSMLTAELQNQIVQIEQQMSRVIAESIEKLQAAGRDELALSAEGADHQGEGGKPRRPRQGRAEATG